MTTPILLIEGAPSLGMVYRAILERAGNAVRSADTLAEGLAGFHETRPCVVILDGMLGGAEQEAMLRHFKSAHPDTKVLMTLPQSMLSRQSGTLDAAIFDILVKPFNELRLLGAVSDARTEILRERLEKTAAVTSQVPLSLMGESPATLTVRERLAAFAQSTAPVMISGAAGTGKSDCARLLHSQRRATAGGVLHEVAGSTATPDSLNARLRAAAPEDSLLLHNIDQLAPLTAQSLLSLIRSESLPVRAVISTLEGTVSAALADPQQNADLIHRLNALPLQLPTLADRNGDLCQIANAALPELCAVENRGPMVLSDAAAERLMSHDWPGNIPELINTLRRILVLHAGPEITADHVDQALDCSTIQRPLGAPLTGQTLADIERAVIEQSIANHDGSVPRAAKSLGVSPSTLYRKRESWGADA